MASPQGPTPEADLRPASCGVFWLAGLAAGGCAVLTCHPTTVVVAAKDVQVRLDSRVVGLRTDALNRVTEVRREAIVRDYWIKDTEGRWYPVSRDTWESAAVGEQAEACRQERAGVGQVLGGPVGPFRELQTLSAWHNYIETQTIQAELVDNPTYPATICPTTRS